MNSNRFDCVKSRIRLNEFQNKIKKLIKSTRKNDDRIFYFTIGSAVAVNDPQNYLLCVFDYHFYDC